MSLVVIGVSHQTAPVDVRERVAFPEQELEEALKRAVAVAGGGERSGEVMILSTCNRVEFYLAGRSDDGSEARKRVAAFLGEARQVREDDLLPHLYAHAGTGAVRHLFRVAASLDSAVVGEPQILGQVKDAYESARRAGTVGSLLGQVVPRSFAAAKRVRTETAVARSSASVASAAVDLGRRIFGDLRGKEVMVVGTGKMGDLATRHLIAAGCGRLLLVNRTARRAEELAERIRETGGTAEPHPFSSLVDLLVRADIVLCSTGAVEPVITREMVQKAMKARKGRWLCLLDIAVPRDVEPAAGEVENVYLYDVDALAQVVDDNLTERQKEAELAERIVTEEVDRFLASESARGVVPTIKALRERFHAIARAEAQRTLGKLQDASDKQRREVEAMAESIANKQLHPILTAIKREAESELFILAVHKMFDLGEASAAQDRPAAGSREARAVGGDEPEAQG